MFGTVSDERDVNVPASEAWKVYGSLQLSKIVGESLPDIFSKIDIIEGDGGVGTILEVFVPIGTPGMTSFKEKFTVVDNLKMVKEIEVIEGGYLNLGFTYFRIQLEVIEKEDKNCCITKSTIEYEVKEEAAANASVFSIQSLKTINELVAEYLVNNYNKNTTNSST